jgi:epoxyqueuosine reductase
MRRLGRSKRGDSRAEETQRIRELSDVGSPPVASLPTINPTYALKNHLFAQARRLGFDAVRVAAPDALGPAGERLRAFLAQGRHGDMEWMETHADRRADPRKLMPDVRSIIMLGMSYAPARDPLAVLAERSRGAISAYAKGRDYHDVLKSKLKQLARLLQEHASADVKVFVDTAPLLEKPLAAAAGIGWQGKHTNLVSRTHGSWLFLGAILTSAALEPDPPEEDHCGTCRRCLDICPTAAFPAPYQLDARRCIAYLTIEHKGHIPREFREPIGNRVFGCDDCLAVCPWNKFAATAREMRFVARTETDAPPLAELLALDDAAFRARFAGTPVKRTGRDRLVRNALIAAGNSGDGSLVPQVRRLLADASPLVRAMAVWALARLCESREVASLRASHLPRESDGAVRAEWRATEAA